MEQNLRKSHFFYYLHQFFKYATKVSFRLKNFLFLFNKSKNMLYSFVEHIQ